MTTGLDVQDGGVLYGILADLGGDIVIKSDRFGFIEQASHGLSEAGFDLSQQLIAPHLADLTDALHAGLVRETYELAMQTGEAPQAIEIPLCAEGLEPQWYALTLRPLPAHAEKEGGPVGAIAVMRCVEQERALQSRLFASAKTDPLTGIANRHAFFANVNRLMLMGQSGAVALFEIDRFRAIGLRFGQQASDSVIEAFAGFLANMLDETHILARIEDNRFAVMLPGVDQREAIDCASEIVSTFAEISRDAELEEMRLTASASVCQLGECLDETLMRGEVALTLARSAGGFRVECGDAIRDSWRSRKTA
ncbi:GGDEF domain-containing protein [Altererythrobacter lutimaris]|uniref:GGDEF domain-containing protein n=1 Tax=Altererythrobacter lutimaris TaxID=2743979 RepID=A0A850HDZ7_9SPHN|nr:GGDEF domain-containing protein [Altererythrobacter lutimaris]NVE95018.1 GGDEF domain-containing protein [Altererythrobacter lutimaris]